MSWDEQLVEDFLQEYRKHECLWNPFHRQFHDCSAKGEALKKVVKNSRLGFGVQDCLRLLKCIRKKYVEDQTKNLLTLRSSLCQPRWTQIVESMLEKIVCDEDCKTSYLAPLSKKTEPAVKVLFRHTITSKKRKCPTHPKQKRRRSKRIRKQRGKLERRGWCCNDNAERDMDSRRDAQDCSRPQTNWCKQRDDYLDKLAWTQPRAKPAECPGLASHIERVSRVENIGKDPCASTPVYMCPNRSTHVNCNQNYGRRRQMDIYPTITESRSCKSPPPRPSTCPPPRPTKCPPRKPSPERNSCPSAKKEKKHCPSPVEEKCAIDKDVCTRDTCPSYNRPKPNEPKACDVVAECTERKPSSSAACTSVVPRVAARFENGVLEACSQFKVVFPSQDQQQQQQQQQQSSSKRKCCAQKVQTDCTTRERAVGVCSRELLREKSANKCPRKKDTRIGTAEDRLRDSHMVIERSIVECRQENEQPEDPCHDYVLLTPGGKYVPLVRTKSETNDECTCSNGSENKRPRQDPCETIRQCARDSSAAKNREKQNAPCQLDDDPCCSSTTTKLILRCLEHMLNLEEQQCTGKTADASDNICEPCRRKERQLADNANSNCLPCLEERLKCASQRGKLTQHFLEILKCAMELDCGRRDNEEDRCCCRCEAPVVVDECKRDEPIQRKVSVRERAAGEGYCVDAESNATQDKVTSCSIGVQCDARKSREKQPVKRDTVLDNLVRCANWPEYKTARNLSVALKCYDDDANREPNVKRVPATTLPPSPPVQRDHALVSLREELQRDKEYFDRGNVSYVKCNQVYRSCTVRSPHTSPTRLSGRFYR